MAHAILTFSTQPFPARRRYEAARACFEAAGDLEAISQHLVESFGVWIGGADSRAVEGALRRALSIAEHTGNLEQQILVGTVMSRLMLEIGDDESAYAFFSRSLQIADQNGLGVRERPDSPGSRPIFLR